MSDSKWKTGKDVFINLISSGNEDSNKSDMQRGGNNLGDWVNLEFIVVSLLISESYFNIPHGGRTNVLGKRKYFCDYQTSIYS